MTQAKSVILVCFLALSACAAEEQEVILTEPRPMEDAAAAEAVLPCETGDDDGIGGTGCQPLE
ncbi:MAG: hypothetical protein HKN18_11025 [Silicimonas sp.]|nr:hypothetical protein [Silicimonas sp.]